MNFESFSDNSLVKDLTLEKEHFLGISRFENQLIFKNISDSFYAGNRLYVEVGYPSYPSGMKKLNWNRFHIDFTDRNIPPAPFDWLSLFYWIAIPSASVVTVAVLLLSTWYYIKGEASDS
jgi:hypothetical protein